MKFPSDFDEWHGTKMSHLRNNDLADLVEKLEVISMDENAPFFNLKYLFNIHVYRPYRPFWIK